MFGPRVSGSHVHMVTHGMRTRRHGMQGCEVMPVYACDQSADVPISSKYVRRQSAWDSLNLDFLRDEAVLAAQASVHTPHPPQHTTVRAHVSYVSAIQ